MFEHNAYNPIAVRIVNDCSFDANAQLMRGAVMKRQMTQAGFATARIRYRVFVPRPLRILRPLERALAWPPFGGQYYVLARK